jgi:phenolic acid decarboxylase
MATLDKKIADEIVAGKYAEDHPVKIVRYTNAWGGESYGVIFEGEDLNRYAASDFVINPTVYWTKEGGKVS